MSFRKRMAPFFLLFSASAAGAAVVAIAHVMVEQDTTSSRSTSLLPSALHSNLSCPQEANDTDDVIYVNCGGFF